MRINLLLRVATLPICLFLLQLVLIAAGPIEFPAINGIFAGYMIIAIGALFLGLFGGFLIPHGGAGPPAVRTAFIIYLWITIISFLGGCMVMVDYWHSGLSPIWGIQNPDLVRSTGVLSANPTTFITTIGSPLSSMSYLAMALWFYLRARGISAGWITGGAMMASLAFTLLANATAASRQSFLFVGFCLISCATILCQRPFKDGWHLLGRTGQLVAIVTMLCCSTYIVYVASFRETEIYNEYLWQTNRMRYRINALESLPPAIRNGTYNLLFYFIHPWSNYSEIVPNLDELVTFRSDFLWWHLCQISKLSGKEVIPEDEKAASWIMKAGIEASAWKTGMCRLNSSFGWLGTLAFLSLFGFVWGYALGTFEKRRSIGGFLVGVWCLNGILVGFMFLPNENSFHVNLIMSIIFLIFKIGERGRRYSPEMQRDDILIKETTANLSAPAQEPLRRNSPLLPL